VDIHTAAAARTEECCAGNDGKGKGVAAALLRPELINDYGSAVIRAARAHIDEIGCAAEWDVFERKIDFEGVDRLPEADEDLLLRAMVQTFLDKSLCIAEDTPQGKQLIFPSQYRRERGIPQYPEIFVFCILYLYG
jgi:hypothetical protein